MTNLDDIYGGLLLDMGVLLNKLPSAPTKAFPSGLQKWSTEVCQHFYFSGLLPEEAFTHHQISYQTFLSYARGHGYFPSTTELSFTTGMMAADAYEYKKKVENMRTNEEGEPCPETLGEYWNLCYRLSGYSMATDLLGKQIAERGTHYAVPQSNRDMRRILMPLVLEPSEEVPDPSEGDTLGKLRKYVYDAVCGVASDLVEKGWTVLVDINQDRSKSDDEWEIVMAVEHPKGESTFLIRATPTPTFTHLSSTRGEAINLGGFGMFKTYLEDFYT